MWYSSEEWTKYQSVFDPLEDVDASVLNGHMLMQPQEAKDLELPSKQLCSLHLRP
jgi:hypothetical protein